MDKKELRETAESVHENLKIAMELEASIPVAEEEFEDARNEYLEYLEEVKQRKRVRIDDDKDYQGLERLLSAWCRWRGTVVVGGTNKEDQDRLGGQVKSLLEQVEGRIKGHPPIPGIRVNGIGVKYAKI